MSKYINYEPLFMDGIDYKKCKYLINEVCINDKSEFLADYPSIKFCTKENNCGFYEKEDGKI